MADLNVMPWFTDSYLADTIDLSDAEHGSYCLLLMAMWRAGGSLPDEPGLLSRIAKVPAKAWPKRWLVLSRFFSRTSEGRLTQKKLSETYRKAIEKRDRYIENGKKGAEAKALKNKETAQATPQATTSPAIANLNPESLNPNRDSESVANATAPVKVVQKKEKPESLTKQRRKPIEEMTADERAKLAFWERAAGMGIGAGLIARLYNAYGGDKAMAAATRMSSKVLNSIESGKVRDKRSYIGAVISKLGKEDAAHLESWDTSL